MDIVNGTMKSDGFSPSKDVHSDVKYTFWQMYRYFFIALLAAIVDFSVFQILYTCGVPYPIATTVSFILGLLVNYFLAITFVFKAEAKMTLFEFFVFGIIGIVGLGITILVLYLGIDVIALPSWVSKIGAIGVTFVWNFTAKKFILFRGKHNE